VFSQNLLWVINMHLSDRSYGGATMMRLWMAILLLTAVATAGDAEPVNLKEFFPFGMWVHGTRLTGPGIDHPTVADDLQALGVNFVCTVASTNVPPNSDDGFSVASILKSAQQHNLNVLLMLTPLVKARLSRMSPDDLRSAAEEAKRELAPFVAEGRKFSSLLGWHLADEPKGEAKCTTAEIIRQIFAELDPDHPGWTEGGWSVLADSVVPQIRIIQQDVCQPEVYPLWDRPYHCGIGDFRFAGFKPPPDQQGQDDWITLDLVDHYRELRPLLQGRHIWPWIQSFREHYKPPSWYWRSPTPEEVRCLTWISVAEGCRGLCWFGSHHLMRHFGDYAKLSPEIQSLITAVRPLTDILLNTSVVENLAQLRGGGSRYYRSGLVETLRDPDGVHYIVVVNRNCESNGHETLTVQVPAPLPGGSGTLLAVDPADNSVIATHWGTPLFAFSVRLRPGEGKLIRLIHATAALPLDVQPQVKSIKVGESIDFTATGGVGEAGHKYYRWSTSNPQVGSLDPLSGHFMATAAGRCQVRVRDMIGTLATTRDIKVVE